MTRSLGARLWPAAVFQFCFIGAVAMLKPGANALTLSRFSTDALPWLYMAAAAIASVLAIWGGRGKRRSQPGQLALFGMVIAVALAAGVWLSLPFMALAAYLFSEAFATQVALSFWGAMGESFDAREARRAFSWINGVGMTGAIVGGFSAQLLARTAGALALLVAGGVFLALGAVVWRFHRVDVEPTNRGADGAKAAANWKEIARSPYAQLMAVLVLGLSLLQQLTDYVFRQRASAMLVESDMAELFASHQLWTGVFCVLFQFALAEVLLRKLGILRYAALIPITLAGLTLGTWLLPSVWSAWGLKVFEAASSWSLMPVALQLMYAPLPDSFRDGARRGIDGLVRKGGMAVAGLLILGLASWVGLNGIFVLVFAICAVLGVTLWRIRPLYVEAVHARVAGLDASGTFDGEERLLAQAIQSASDEQVLRAIDMLQRSELLREEHVRQLLVHPHERVQERAVGLADAMSLKSLAKLLEGIIAHGARRPRDAAIWALSRLAPDRARVVLPPLLTRTDVGILTSTIGGLLTMPGPEHPEAKQILAGLLSRGVDAPAAERREVARLLGRLRKPELARALVSFLDDAESSVRRVAIDAAGEGHYVELAPRLLRFLTWRDERKSARESLAKLGDPVVPLLASALDDRSRSRSLRLQLPRVLRLMKSQSALDALLFSNPQDDSALHYRIGLALAQLHDECPELKVDTSQLRDALERRRTLSLELLEPYRDARAELGDEALLTRVLADRLDQAMELSFWLLGLKHDARGLRRAHTLLLGPDARRRAWALELLDNVLEPDERRLVSHHVDSHHRSLELGDRERFDGWLPMLSRSDDFNLRSCARAVGRRRGLWPQAHREDDMNETVVKRLFALEGVEIFAQSDVDDLAAIAAVAKEQRFARGARVYSEGDPGDALYVIVDGEVEARRDDEWVMTIKTKECFGETSLFDGAPRVNDVVAISDTRVLVIDRRDFLDLLADRPELLAGMFRALSRQLKSMVVDVATRRATGELSLSSVGPVTGKS